MTIEEDRALSTSSYWDARYAAQPAGATTTSPTHEWFRSFIDLEPFFQKNLFSVPAFFPTTGPQILHLGSGDSTVPADLAQKGYRHQLCVDFSSVVVQTMSVRHQQVEGISWREMDVRRMEGLNDGSIDVAFDKGTLDAMVHGSPWDPPAEVRVNVGAYLREVYRVLKADGIFLYVTFRQPHFMKPLLNAEGQWDMQMQTLGDGSGFDYYGWVIRKKR